jgi:predicted MFS family arabinose efflux permease
VLLGSTQAVAQPARQSMVPGMVPRHDLPGAVALNSLCYNLARSVGPGIGGLIVATWGVVPAMLVNCCGYLFASITMSTLRLEPNARRGHAPTGSVMREAMEGILYVVRHPGMGPLFLYATIVGVLVRAVPEMLPPFVAQLFGRGPEGLATLSSAIGLAALVGGLTVALHARLTGLVRYAVVSGTLVALATGGFVATHSFFFAVVCASVMGAATTVHGISIQTLLQSATSSHMIGRVISLWGMLTRVTPAIGALAYGAASEVVGLQAPVLLGALLAVGACVLAVRRLPRMVQSLELVEA